MGDALLAVLLDLLDGAAVPFVKSGRQQLNRWELLLESPWPRVAIQQDHGSRVSSRNSSQDMLNFKRELASPLRTCARVFLSGGSCAFKRTK